MNRKKFEFVKKMNISVNSLPYLINGESHNLTDDEINDLNIFIDDFSHDCLVFDVIKESFDFNICHIFGLHSDTYNVKIYGFIKSSL